MPPLGGVPKLIADTNIPYVERFVDSWMSLGSQPWSPDGRELLFSRLDLNGRIALWKVNLETNHQTRLTSPPLGSDDLQAAWSFDGQSIVIMRRQAGLHGLWLMAAVGGEPRALLRDANDNGGPAWTTDNQRIVFHSDRSGTLNLFELQINSGRMRRLTTGMGDDDGATVGHNGGLLYAHHSSHTDLYQLNLKNAKEHQLTSNSARNYRPRLSPANRLVVYDSNRTGNFDIWLLDPESGSERALTDDPAVDLAPDWSPDGKRIVFLSNRDGFFRLWVSDIEQGTSYRLLEQRVLAPAATSQGVAGQTSSPRWSPDGRKIGFLVGSEEQAALWSVDPDGQNSRQLIQGAVSFDWLRDSVHVVYTRRARDGLSIPEIVLANVEDGREQIIHRGPSSQLTAARDGTGIIFEGGTSKFQQNLFLLHLHPIDRYRAAQRPQQLTKAAGPWHAHNGGWSSDAKAIVYVRDRLEADIYIIENFH
jgi:Tol biopolymer transport system component